MPEKTDRPACAGRNGTFILAEILRIMIISHGAGQRGMGEGICPPRDDLGQICTRASCNSGRFLRSRTRVREWENHPVPRQEGTQGNRH